MNSIKYYLPGALLLLFALLILVRPEVLVVLIASVVAFAGVWATLLGHAMSKSEHVQRNVTWFWR